MKNRLLAPLLFGSALALSASAIGVAQSAPAPAGGGLNVLDFRPGFDDLMTMLVQPRHIKLYAAGQARNWELAGFQLNELRASFRRIGQTLPRYRTYEMDSSVASIIAPAIAKMDGAIKAADPAQFTAAYGELTAACNTCHTAMEHAFLIIKMPDAAALSPYTDQEFRK